MSETSNIRKTTYRLYPTARQALALGELLRSHQQLYNAALQERIDCYSKTGKGLSFADQCKSLTELRQALPEWQEPNCSSRQMTLRRLDKAFGAFFRRLKAGQTPGFPRFKSLARYPGFSFKSHGDGWRFTPGTNWRHGTLRLSGVGHLRARGQARVGGDVRASEVVHRNGQWFLSLTVAVAPAAGQVLRQRTDEAAMAYDWGVSTFLTGVTHTGEVLAIDNPRWHRASQDKIQALQQAVSRKTNKRSNRRRRAVARLASERALVARRRLDWLHKLTAGLAARYALVASEQLQVQNMTRSAAGTAEQPGQQVAQKAGLNREILDTAPGLFTSLLRYKVQETGGEYVEAPTRTLKPSQRCPACWAVAKKALSERMHACPSCGHTEPRDLASARTVLRWALLGQNTGQELADAGFISRETPSFARA